MPGTEPCRNSEAVERSGACSLGLVSVNRFCSNARLVELPNDSIGAVLGTTEHPFGLSSPMGSILRDELRGTRCYFAWRAPRTGICSSYQPQK